MNPCGQKIWEDEEPIFKACKECGKRVGINAPACPDCGCKEFVKWREQDDLL